MTEKYATVRKLGEQWTLNKGEEGTEYWRNALQQLDECCCNESFFHFFSLFFLLFCFLHEVQVKVRMNCSSEMKQNINLKHTLRSAQIIYTRAVMTVGLFGSSLLEARDLNFRWVFLHFEVVWEFIVRFAMCHQRWRFLAWRNISHIGQEFCVHREI